MARLGTFLYDRLKKRLDCATLYSEVITSYGVLITMNRGQVVQTVVSLPMRVHAQQEGDRIVIKCPAWKLPHDLLVEGVDMDDALEKLEEKMRKYWGKA